MAANLNEVTIVKKLMNKNLHHVFFLCRIQVAPLVAALSKMRHKTKLLLVRPSVHTGDLTRSLVDLSWSNMAQTGSLVDLTG